MIITITANFMSSVYNSAAKFMWGRASALRLPVGFVSRPLAGRCDGRLCVAGHLICSWRPKGATQARLGSASRIGPGTITAPIAIIELVRRTLGWLSIASDGPAATLMDFLAQAEPSRAGRFLASVRAIIFHIIIVVGAQLVIIIIHDPGRAGAARWASL